MVFILNVLDEMTVHFHMFCMLVIDWIRSNLNGARNVNMECRSKKTSEHAKIIEQWLTLVCDVDS